MSQEEYEASAEEAHYFSVLSEMVDLMLEQHVNGVISYIPRLHKHTLQSEVEKYFNGKES